MRQLYLQQHKGIKNILNVLKDDIDPELKKTARGAFFVLYQEEQIVASKIYEPRRKKTCLQDLQTTQVQTSLSIRAV